MKPIDCTTMEVGDRAVTRDGREAELVCVLDVSERKWVFSIANKEVACFYAWGNYINNQSVSPGDLFEIPVTVDFYVNVYENCTVSAHPNREAARMCAVGKKCFAIAKKYTFTEGQP